MTTKKMIFISTIGTFLLCFLTHFLYDFFPNTFFSIFFPVNESIWEHMKMIYTTTFLFGIIEYILLSKFDLDRNNFLLTLFLKAFCSIPIYLAIYLPIYYRFGENMIVTLLLLFLVLLLSNYVGYQLLSIREIKYQNVFAFLFIILGFILFGYFTYKPLHTHLFFDTQKEKYGIHEYLAN